MRPYPAEETSFRDNYRRLAYIYDYLEPFNRALRRYGLGLFPPGPGMAVLDIGCGTGVHLEMYQKYGCRLHGIDSSPAMLGIAGKRLGREAELILGSATDLPYPAKTFDLVICMLALHEMEEIPRGQVIAELKRVIKDDGRILLIDFHAGPPRSLRGRLGRVLSYLIEFLAGRRHFRNFRNFIATGGLPTLIENHGLAVEKELLVGGGSFALYLLKDFRNRA